MRRPLAYATAGTAVVIAGSILAASPVGAHTGRVPTSVTADKGRTPPSIQINYCNPPCVPVSVFGPGYEIRGTLDSAESHCLGDRRVALYRTNRMKPIADGTTDGEGAFLFDLGSDYARGEWYVRVLKRDIREAPHRHRCAAATSEIVPVP